MNAISKYAVTDVDTYLRWSGLARFYMEDMSGNAKRKLADYLLTIEIRRFNNKPGEVQEWSVPRIIEYWENKGVKVEVKRV